MNTASDSFFLSHPDPMWIYDLDSLRFMAVNNAAVAKYGYSREEFFALTIADIRPDEDLLALKSSVAAVTDGHSNAGVWRHLLKSGELIYVDITGHTIEHQGRRAELIAARDVTERVESATALARAKRMLEIAGTLAKFGAWRYEVKSDKLEWSTETARIHDEPDGFSPKIVDALAYYPPEYRDRIATVFQECIDRGQPFDETLQILTAKGRRIWVRATGEADCEETGHIVAVEGAFQDITDLIVAREDATELSERLRLTLEGMSDAFFLLDQDWHFVFVNTQAQKMLRRAKDDLLGKNIWQEFPEAVGSKFQIGYERAVTEDEPVFFEEYYPSLETWFEVSAEPTATGLAVYFSDITEERRRSEQLRLLEAAVMHQNDILVITEAEPIDGPDGPKIVYVNDAFVRRTGFSRDEVIGKTPRILQGPKTQRDELDRIRNALVKWEPVRAELINYTKLGEEFWLELDIVPLANETGWFTHWISVERDITERKKWEQDLETSEERFRLVARAGGSVVWEWDILCNEQWWSEGLTEIFGHSPEPEKTAPKVWSAHVHPDDRPRVDAALEDLCARRAYFFKERYRFRRADGSWAIVEDCGFARRAAEGQVTHILGSMTDISDQLDLEDRLRQAQKMEAVGQLTGGVAHDFNNLLTIMLGNAELLSESLDSQPTLRDMAETITSTAERGAELTSRLLSFSRKQALEPRVVDIGRLIQGLESMLRRTLPENIDIEIIRGGGLWNANIDSSQLETALINLVLNARDAMPDGGTLTIETSNAALDEDYVAREYDVSAGQYVLIAVSDSGSGIPAESIDRIFEPFFTTKTGGKGTGLGLSMVYGFVKQSGGHIRVYSEEGVGTSLKLYFPRAREKEEQPPLTQITPRSIGGSETILVVEDDALVRNHVVSQLESLGYTVIEAPAGKAALDMLHKEPRIDLLFTDVVMPGGMSGRELADAALVLRPNLKVLYTSGYTSNAIVHNGQLDQGVDLLSKPYRREQLAVKVRAVLDRKAETP